MLTGSVNTPYIGEPISQLEHVLQTADQARSSGCAEEVVLAALLHDIGHLLDPKAPQMDGFGTQNHAAVGAAFLQKLGFSSRTQALVRAHVDAKRYLCRQNPHYAARLSEASLATLKWQGGAMTPIQGATFEKSIFFADALKLRSFDEKAKDADYTSPNRELYRKMIERHLKSHPPQIRLPIDET